MTANGMRSQRWQPQLRRSNPEQHQNLGNKKGSIKLPFFHSFVDQLTFENLAIDIKVTAFPVKRLALPAGMSFWKPAV